MKVRALTALVFVAVTLSAILVNAHTFTVFIFLLAVLGVAEFYKMVKSEISVSGRILGILLSVGLFSVCAAYQYGVIFSLSWLILLIPLITIIFIAELYGKSAQPFSGLGYSFLGVLYVVVPFIFFFVLAFVEERYNFRIPLGFLLILWANDTGAYLTGKTWGRNKLFERISPKKTWEGLFGGIVLAFVAGAVNYYCFATFSLASWMIVALIIAVFGTLGDLVESMLKRSLSVKDSGTILPGHGGLLDRFDGLLLAAPLVYFYLLLFS